MASDRSISQEYTSYDCAALDGFCEFELSATMEVSEHWKGLCKGRACKQSKYFCQCCPVESKDVHHPNEIRCVRYCADRNDDDRKCYHHDITMETSLQEMKQDIQEMRQQLSCSLESIANELRFNFFPENHLGRVSVIRILLIIVQWVQRMLNVTQSCFLISLSYAHLTL
jgi:hypothetical protein